MAGGVREASTGGTLMYRWIAYMALIAMPATGFAELDESEVRQFFDAAFEIQRQEHELAGAVVSVVQDGDVLFKKGYGFADIAARTPADDVVATRIP